MPTVAVPLEDIPTDPRDDPDLTALPGDRFSGLQLMCLMHVGFKRVEPSADPRTGLDEAYARALAMYRARDE